MTLSAHDHIRFESAKKDLRAVFFAAASRIRESDLPPSVTKVAMTAIFNEWETIGKLFDHVLKDGVGADDEGVMQDLALIEQMRDELADIIASNR